VPPPLRLGAMLLPSRVVSQVRDLKRRSAAAATAAALAPAPSAADSSSDVPYIETLTQIFELVAATFMQQEQLALFIGGAAAAAGALQAAQEAAVQQQLAVLDAFVEDFNIAKRAHTLRSKQVREDAHAPKVKIRNLARRAAHSTRGR
jgi:hypothetical protein